MKPQFTLKTLLILLAVVLAASVLLALASPDFNSLIARLTGQYNKDFKVVMLGMPAIEDAVNCPGLKPEQFVCYRILVAFQNESRKEAFSFFPYDVEAKDADGKAYKPAQSVLVVGSTIDPVPFGGTSFTTFYFAIPKGAHPVELDYAPYERAVGVRKLVPDKGQ